MQRSHKPQGTLRFGIVGALRWGEEVECQGSLGHFAVTHVDFMAADSVGWAALKHMHPMHEDARRITDSRL